MSDLLLKYLSIRALNKMQPSSSTPDDLDESSDASDVEEGVDGSPPPPPPTRDAGAGVAHAAATVAGADSRPAVAVIPPPPPPPPPPTRDAGAGVAHAATVARPAAPPTPPPPPATVAGATFDARPVTPPPPPPPPPPSAGPPSSASHLALNLLRSLELQSPARSTIVPEDYIGRTNHGERSSDDGLRAGTLPAAGNRPVPTRPRPGNTSAGGGKSESRVRFEREGQGALLQSDIDEANREVDEIIEGAQSVANEKYQQYKTRNESIASSYAYLAFTSRLSVLLKNHGPFKNPELESFFKRSLREKLATHYEKYKTHRASVQANYDEVVRGDGDISSLRVYDFANHLKILFDVNIEFSLISHRLGFKDNAISILQDHTIIDQSKLLALKLADHFSISNSSSEIPKEISRLNAGVDLLKAESAKLFYQLHFSGSKDEQYFKLRYNIAKLENECVQLESQISSITDPFLKEPLYLELRGKRSELTRLFSDDEHNDFILAVKKYKAQASYQKSNLETLKNTSLLISDFQARNKNKREQCVAEANFCVAQINLADLFGRQFDFLKESSLLRSRLSEQLQGDVSQLISENELYKIRLLHYKEKLRIVQTKLNSSIDYDHAEMSLKLAELKEKTAKYSYSLAQNLYSLSSYFPSDQPRLNGFDFSVISQETEVQYNLCSNAHRQLRLTHFQEAGQSATDSRSRDGRGGTGGSRVSGSEGERSEGVIRSDKERDKRFGGGAPRPEGELDSNSYEGLFDGEDFVGTDATAVARQDSSRGLPGGASVAGAAAGQDSSRGRSGGASATDAAAGQDSLRATEEQRRSDLGGGGPASHRQPEISVDQEGDDFVEHDFEVESNEDDDDNYSGNYKVNLSKIVMVLERLKSSNGEFSLASSSALLTFKLNPNFDINVESSFIFTLNVKPFEGEENNDYKYIFDDPNGKHTINQALDQHFSPTEYEDGDVYDKLYPKEIGEFIDLWNELFKQHELTGSRNEQAKLLLEILDEVSPFSSSLSASYTEIKKEFNSKILKIFNDPSSIDIAKKNKTQKLIDYLYFRSKELPAKHELAQVEIVQNPELIFFTVANKSELDRELDKFKASDNSQTVKIFRVENYFDELQDGSKTMRSDAMRSDAIVFVKKEIGSNDSNQLTQLVMRDEKDSQVKTKYGSFVSTQDKIIARGIDFYFRNVDEELNQVSFELKQSITAEISKSQNQINCGKLVKLFYEFGAINQTRSFDYDQFSLPSEIKGFFPVEAEESNCFIAGEHNIDKTQDQFFIGLIRNYKIAYDFLEGQVNMKGQDLSTVKSLVNLSDASVIANNPLMAKIFQQQFTSVEDGDLDSSLIGLKDGGIQITRDPTSPNLIDIVRVLPVEPTPQGSEGYIQDHNIQFVAVKSKGVTLKRDLVIKGDGKNKTISSVYCFRKVNLTSAGVDLNCDKLYYKDTTGQIQEVEVCNIVANQNSELLSDLNSMAIRATVVKKCSSKYQVKESKISYAKADQYGKKIEEFAVIKDGGIEEGLTSSAYSYAVLSGDKNTITYVAWNEALSREDKLIYTKSGLEYFPPKTYLFPIVPPAKFEIDSLGKVNALKVIGEEVSIILGPIMHEGFMPKEKSNKLVFNFKEHKSPSPSPRRTGELSHVLAGAVGQARGPALSATGGRPRR